jgi:hypothetical protein
MDLLEQIKENNLSEEQINQLSERMKINQINYPEWRLGQLIFNSLYEVKPKLANMIRGTFYDSYHADYKKCLNLLILFTNPEEYKE